jgi:hypothetical protein
MPATNGTPVVKLATNNNPVVATTQPKPAAQSQITQPTPKSQIPPSASQPSTQHKAPIAVPVKKEDPKDKKDDKKKKTSKDGKEDCFIF